MAEITLEFLGHQMERILTEMGAIRDDIVILTGISIRLEGALEGLAVEVRGMRSKLDRLDHRIRKLEGQS